MLYTPPLNPHHHNLQPLLTATGVTLDWLNTDCGDPHARHTLARANLTATATTIPIHFAAATPTRPEVLAWTRQLADTAETERARRGREYAAITTGPSLLLLGSTGVGKTWEAYGAMRALALTGAVGRWTTTTAADLYAALRPRHGIDSEAEFRRYRDARLLLIDDLGAERAPTEFTEEINYRLVNWRYEHHLPTLITTNNLPKQLAARLGDRVTSRLAEMCQRVVLTGPDRRRGGNA